MKKLTTQPSDIVDVSNFIYPSIVTVGPQSTVTDTIQIQAESDFLLTKLTHWVGRLPGTETTVSNRIIPPVLLQWTDTGNSRQMFEQPIPISILFGTAEDPFYLPSARRFLGNSSLILSYQNLSLANTYVIYLAFIGTKVFRKSI